MNGIMLLLITPKRLRFFYPFFGYKSRSVRCIPNIYILVTRFAAYTFPLPAALSQSRGGSRTVVFIQYIMSNIAEYIYIYR